MRNIVLHYVLPSLLALVAFGFAIRYWVYPGFEDLTMDANRQSLRQLTHTVVTLLEAYERRIRAGELTRDEAQQRAIAEIRDLRYGPEPEQYYFLLDTQCRMIVNAAYPEEENQDVSRKTDPSGKAFYADMVTLAMDQGGGYVQYLWRVPRSPGKTREKLSYAEPFKPWGWIVGTGLYWDHIEMDMGVMRTRFRNIALVTFVVVGLLSTYSILRGLRIERERANALRTLKDNEERFRLLAESATDWIFWRAPDGRMLYCSPACAAITGRSPQDFYDDSEMIDACVYPEDLSRWQAHCAVTANAALAEPLDLRIVSSDGAVRWVSHICKPIRREDGVFLGVWGSNRDITQRVEAERVVAEKTKELEAANDELIRRNHELDQFAYMASHDLQEPLRKLIAFGGMLPRDLAGVDLPERAEKDLHFIIASSRQMETLVQDLLRLSRTSRAEMKPTRISLHKCALAAIEILAVRIKETDASVTMDQLPTVFGDATLMTQLYQNLISNAIKFAGGRRPEVHLTLETTEAGPVFGVKDNGIGIDPAYAAQVFEPFKRLHGRGEYEGSGIGLAICHKVIERHGGRIWVESEVGKGAHFRFVLRNCACGEEDVTYDCVGA